MRYNIAWLMKIGIFYHEKKIPAGAVERLEKELSVSGAQVFRFCGEQEIGGIDRLVVLGGDGAMLRAARQCSKSGIPLVGVNYGTIGFLTEFERGEEAQAASLALDLHCGLIARTMLEAVYGGKSEHCLNEVAFLRRIAPDAADEVVHIRVNIGGSSAGEFRADGLILSTPTGSTAYSLSAGGSILTPECAAFLLTPVNAFSLRSRPIVCSDGSTLSFSFPTGVVEMYGDGEFLGELHGGEEVTVKKSERHAVFMTKGRQDFFRRLTEKIN